MDEKAGYGFMKMNGGKSPVFWISSAHSPKLGYKGVPTVVKQISTVVESRSD
jgi:hypothetical protein